VSLWTDAGVPSVARVPVAVVAAVGEIVLISSGNLSVGEIVSRFVGEGVSLKSIGDMK
jgi:hypothetical protein